MAVRSLAPGIGANTAIFSIVNSLLLKPLPVRDAQSLVALGSDRPGEDIDGRDQATAADIAVGSRRSAPRRVVNH